MINGLNPQQSKPEQKIWTEKEDAILIEVFNNYQSASKKWKKVASHLKGKSPKQCYSRYRQINPSFKHGVWTKIEETKLLELVEKYGKRWAEIAKVFKTRSGKQIRHHYINILDDKNLKTQFSIEEDMKIRDLYSKFGPKWRKISEYFVGRTGDSIKNRFYNKIKNSFPNDQLSSNSKYLNI